MTVKKLGRCAVLALALCLLLALALVAAAEGDFAEVVAGISENACYADRLARVEQADALWDKMNEEERTAAADSFALLEEERLRLAALARSADRFIMLVDGLSELSDLDEKAESITLAKSDGIYFGDTSYPGIQDALEELGRQDEATTLVLESCYEFMDAVNALVELDVTDYLAVRPKLTVAEEMLEYLDYSLDGVTEAHAIYSGIASKIHRGESYTEEFLGKVGKLRESADYKSCSAVLAEVKSYIGDEDFIEEYPGVAEAREEMAHAEERLKELIREANVFIGLVGVIGERSDRVAAMVEALVAYEAIDPTVDGVKSAKAALDNAVGQYNEQIEKIIEALAFL